MADLRVPALYAVAKPHRIDAAVFQGGPGIHDHGVGVVEKERVGGADFADVLAEGQHLRNIALAIHDATGTERVADALVDTVFERDIDVEREGVEAADARGVEYVVGAVEGAAAIGAGAQGGGQLIGRDVALG